MPRTLSLISLSIALISSSIVHSAETGNLVINIRNLRNINQGELNVVLYRKVDEVDVDMRKAFMLQKAKVKQDRLTITFKELRYGDYAVAAFHDMNSDQKMNTSFLGIPSEDLAISNNAKIGLFNTPTWQEARVRLETNKLVIAPLVMSHMYINSNPLTQPQERGQ